MAEAVTAMSAAGLGVGVGVALVLVEGVGVGVGVAAGVVALFVAPVGPVPVAVGVAVGELAVADGELAAVVELGAWAAEGELLALVAAELTVPDADAETVADAVLLDGVVVARAVPVTPLVMTKRPVARPTVTGRECADRMRTPCLSWLSRRESVLAGMLCQFGGSRCLLGVRASIRHQYQRPMPPLRHTSPHIVSASLPSVTSARAAGLVITRPNSPTVSVPRSVPVYARLSERKPPVPVSSGPGRVRRPGGYPGRLGPVGREPPLAKRTSASPRRAASREPRAPNR